MGDLDVGAAVALEIGCAVLRHLRLTDVTEMAK